MFLEEGQNIYVENKNQKGLLLILCPGTGFYILFSYHVSKLCSEAWK